MSRPWRGALASLALLAGAAAAEPTPPRAGPTPAEAPAPAAAELPPAARAGAFRAASRPPAAVPPAAMVRSAKRPGQVRPEQGPVHITWRAPGSGP